MLSRLLHTIIERPDRYGKQLWSHRISGNILELSVKPRYHQDPDLYRLAIIRTGQVLQAIEYSALTSDIIPFVQSFPNFEEIQLVATVRLKNTFEDPAPLQTINGMSVDPDQSVVNLMQSLASHHGLFFKPMLENANRTQSTSETFAQLPIEISGKKCFALCSITDNPYIWLKTGYWMERVIQLQKDNPSIPPPQILDSIPEDVRPKLNCMSEDCSYVQAIIQI